MSYFILDSIKRFAAEAVVCSVSNRIGRGVMYKGVNELNVVQFTAFGSKKSMTIPMEFLTKYTEEEVADLVHAVLTGTNVPDKVHKELSAAVTLATIPD